MEFLLTISIILTIVGFIVSVEWYIKYLNRSKSKKDKLVDDLISNKITIDDYIIEVHKQLKEEIKKELNYIRKEKLKKIKKNESR